MASRMTFTSILIVIACLVSTISNKVKVKHGTTGMSFSDGTNCSEFSKFGRFNPYSVLNEKWFVFYYWAEIRALSTYFFIAPSANHTKNLKRLLDGNCVLPVMWEARQVMMEDNNGHVSLLVERSDRGEYWLYPVARVKSGQKITPRDVRLKQTGDNRILGIMDCVEKSLLVMARINDVPRKDKLHEEASRLGYRSRKGKSYLYQGHEWGPVPEADEEAFWEYKKPRKDSKDTSKENKSSEGSSEDESKETSKPDHSKEKQSKVKERKSVLPVPGNLEQCVKVEPELWNDPKPNPNPNPDNLRITKEELNNLDTVLILNNTLTIEALEDTPNNTQVSQLEKQSQNSPETDKLDVQQNAPHIEMQLNEPKNLESHTDDPDLNKEDCVVCFKSEVSFINGKSYNPESTSLADSLGNDDEPRSEVSKYEIPHAEQQHKETEYKVPHDKTQHAEVPHGKVSLDEVPHNKVSDTQFLHAKTHSPPPSPTQDSDYSSKIIILSPQKLDELKI